MTYHAASHAPAATYTLNEHGEYDTYNYYALYIPGLEDNYHTTNWFYVTGYCVMIKADSLMEAVEHFMYRFRPQVRDYWLQPQGHDDCVIRIGDVIAYEVSSTFGTYSDEDRPELAFATGQLMCTPTPMGAADGGVVICHSPRILSERVFSRALDFLGLIGQSGVNLSIGERWELRELQVSRDTLTDDQVQRLNDVLNQIEVGPRLARYELDIISSLVRIVPPFDFEGGPPVRRVDYDSSASNAQEAEDQDFQDYDDDELAGLESYDNEDEYENTPVRSRDDDDSELSRIYAESRACSQERLKLSGDWKHYM